MFSNANSAAAQVTALYEKERHKMIMLKQQKAAGTNPAIKTKSKYNVDSTTTDNRTKRPSLLGGKKKKKDMMKDANKQSKDVLKNATSWKSQMSIRKQIFKSVSVQEGDQDVSCSSSHVDSSIQLSSDAGSAAKEGPLVFADFSETDLSRTTDKTISRSLRSYNSEASLPITNDHESTLADSFNIVKRAHATHRATAPAIISASSGPATRGVGGKSNSHASSPPPPPVEGKESSISTDFGYEEASPPDVGAAATTDYGYGYVEPDQRNNTEKHSTAEAMKEKTSRPKRRSSITRYSLTVGEDVNVVTASETKNAETGISTSALSKTSEKDHAVLCFSNTPQGGKYGVIIDDASIGHFHKNGGGGGETNNRTLIEVADSGDADCDKSYAPISRDEGATISFHPNYEDDDMTQITMDESCFGGRSTVDLHDGTATVGAESTSTTFTTSSDSINLHKKTLPTTIDNHRKQHLHQQRQQHEQHLQQQSQHQQQRSVTLHANCDTSDTMSGTTQEGTTTNITFEQQQPPVNISEGRLAEVLRKDITSTDITVLHPALQTILEVVTHGSDKQRDKIVRLGGIASVLRVLEDEDSDTVAVGPIQFLACKLMEKLAAIEPEHCMTIGELSGLPVITGSMHRHAANKSLQRAACRALYHASVCCQDVPVMEDLEEDIIPLDGVVEKLAACMVGNPNDMEIQMNAFGALSNICIQRPCQLQELSETGIMTAMTVAISKKWKSKSKKNEAISNMAILLRGISELDGGADTSDDNCSFEEDESYLEYECTLKGGSVA